MKRFLALLILISLLLLSSCGNGGFSYVTSDLNDYYRLSLSEVTGGKYDVDIPPKVTEEDVWREFRYLQLRYSKNNGASDLDTYLGNPEFGDYVFFYYDISLSPNGEGLFSNLFTEDGADALTIGSWEFPADGEETSPIFNSKAFSDALEKLTPAKRVMTGTVEKGDVIVVDFDHIGKDNVLKTRKTEVRIDTADLSLYEKLYPADFLNALIGKTIGEEGSVKVTVTPEGKTESETHTYNYIVTHKVEEEYTPIAIDVPADAFDEKDGESRVALNGKTIYVRCCIARYVNFLVPDLDAEFFIETLGLKTEETNIEKIKQEAVKKMLTQLEDERLVGTVYPIITDLIFERIFKDKTRVLSFPGGLVKKDYDTLVAKVTDSYESKKKEAADSGLAFAYKDLDEYSANYYGYKAELFDDVYDFCMDEAEYQITRRLATFLIAQLADIRYDEKESDETFAIYVEYLMKEYKNYGVSLTEEELRAINNSDKMTEGEKRYAEYVAIIIKFYNEYYGFSLTEEDVYQTIGTKEELYFTALFTATELNIMKYLYNNNTWNDTTPEP